MRERGLTERQADEIVKGGNVCGERTKGFLPLGEPRLTPCHGVCVTPFALNCVWGPWAYLEHGRGWGAVLIFLFSFSILTLVNAK